MSTQRFTIKQMERLELRLDNITLQKIKEVNADKQGQIKDIIADELPRIAKTMEHMLDSKRAMQRIENRLKKRIQWTLDETNQLIAERNNDEARAERSRYYNGHINRIELPHVHNMTFSVEVLTTKQRLASKKRVDAKVAKISETDPRIKAIRDQAESIKDTIILGDGAKDIITMLNDFASTKF